MLFNTCRRLAQKLVGRDKSCTLKGDRKQQREAKKKSRQLDQALRADWKNESSRIKLLLLGPGEAGKSTLIKQMQLIHGNDMEAAEKLKKIPYIRQNIFDSMVAVLVAMHSMGIKFSNPRLTRTAHIVLSHSQVENSSLTSKDILNSEYLASDDMISHVQALWNDNGVHKAYARSNEYQLLDCAAYFFDRLDDIRHPNYIPTEQDILRCRVMTTSITETKFTVTYSGQKVNFNTVDVGGQQGERRKWITLFDDVTAVIFMLDTSSFDQTLREDSTTNRLLESLKVFYQTITTRFLRSVSILTFMNKIDIFREKIEQGSNFGASLDKMMEQALSLSKDPTISSDFERGIYQKIYTILSENPFTTYNPTENERKHVLESFSTFAAQEEKVDGNHNSLSTFYTSSSSLFSKKIPSRRQKKKLIPDLDWRVVKSAAYIKTILAKIVECVRMSTRYSFQSTPDMSINTGYRSYEFHYTCAVDTLNIKRVIDGCKNIIIKDYFAKIGIPLD
ncbi:guanine nucleotide-binding protein G(o) subunit alpha-like [Watersipora subatra]|uniref:guanine nucleotide-binding protein G(o) subunit alpha-like n=1 Tax=Watersipora subatra TaxID=2589382 RepID=UPI00355C1208